MADRYCSNCFNLIQNSEFDEDAVCGPCSQTNMQDDHEARVYEGISQIRTSVGMVMFGLLVLGGAIMTTTYSPYAFTLSAIQFKRMTGMATRQELKTMSKICLEVGDLNCTETAYRSLASVETDKSAAQRSQKELAHLLFMEKKDSEAQAVFERYYATGGNDLDAAFDYARLLSRDGQDQKSEAYFLKIIEAKPNTLQYTVGKSYVEHLVKTNDLDKAKKFIVTWQHKGKNSEHFLQDELDKIVTKQKHS